MHEVSAPFIFTFGFVGCLELLYKGKSVKHWWSTYFKNFSNTGNFNSSGEILVFIPVLKIYAKDTYRHLTFLYCALRARLSKSYVTSLHILQYSWELFRTSKMREAVRLALKYNEAVLLRVKKIFWKNIYCWIV